MECKLGCVQFGIVTPVKLRHVYSGDMLSVSLIDRCGDVTGDDIVLRLPVAANTVLRPCDPPLLALHLYDDKAEDGHTSDQFGPCPEARRFTRKAVEQAGQLVLHVPIPTRRDWLDSLTPGVQCWGELYVVPQNATSGRLVHSWKLSRQLITAGHARPLEDDYAA